MQAGKSSNVPTSSEMKTGLMLAIENDKTAPLLDVITFATTELASELSLVKFCTEGEAGLEMAPLFYLAGYLARVCEEKVKMQFLLCST